LTKQVKISIAIAGVFVLLVAGLLAFTAGANAPEKATPAKGPSDPRLVRADSHVLGEKADTGVTFVEFLDFECEGCRAAYPAVEQLRKDYAGR
jgi:protein-disulfide isomerase